MYLRGHTSKLLLLITFLAYETSAQFHCPDSLIYGSIMFNSYIRVYNPAKPQSINNPSNTNIPVPVPNRPNGLALMPNINGGYPSPTLYSTLSNTHVCWWNGSTWV